VSSLSGKKFTELFQQVLLLGIYLIQVPTVGKDKHKGPDFMVPIPSVPEKEKESDPSNGNPPSVKLLLDSQGNKIDDPTVQVQPIFNGGTTEQFLSSFRALALYLMDTQ
jgi:hypothetical protein